MIEKVHEARAVADAAKRDAAASAKAAIQTSTTTAKMIEDEAAKARRLQFEKNEVKPDKEIETADQVAPPKRGADSAPMQTTDAAPPMKKRARREPSSSLSSSEDEDEEVSPIRTEPVEMTDRQRKLLKRSMASAEIKAAEKADKQEKKDTVVLYRGTCQTPLHNVTGTRVQIGSFCRTCLERWVQIKEIQP